VKKNLDPLVTVAIPAYNAQDFVVSCFKNLALQTYKNIEIVVSDNCSTDQTFSQIKDNLHLIPGARVIQTSLNLGAISNINFLLSKSNGEFFIVWPLDDLKTPNFLRECVDSLVSVPNAVLCVPRIEVIFGADEKLIASFCTQEAKQGQDPAERFRFALDGLPSTAFYGLFKRSAMNQLGWFPRKLAGDLSFLQGLSLLGPVVYAPKAVLNFKIRAEWNSAADDLRFFFGTEIPEKIRLKFMMFYLETSKFVWNSQINFRYKARIFAQLANHLIRTKTQRAFLVLISQFFQRDTGKRIAVGFYFRFLHPKYIVIEDPKLFLNRIILPTLRYW
jgi:glycosyltransferase involved in cell wall biosynthesis